MGQAISLLTGVKQPITTRFPVHHVPRQQYDRTDSVWFSLAIDNLPNQGKTRRFLSDDEAMGALRAIAEKETVQRLPFESEKPPLAGYHRRRLRFVCASDTHLRMDEVVVPDGDVFVHTGDMMSWRTAKKKHYVEFNNLLKMLPHKHKVVIGGNHDKPLSRSPNRGSRWLSAATYLDQSGCNIEGLTLWGSGRHAYRGVKYGANAFTDMSLEALEASRAEIPDDVDVLLTHVPPQWVLSHGGRQGCPVLLNHVMSRVLPFVHVFGHDHDGYGVGVAPQGLPRGHDEGLSPIFVNAALQSQTLRDPIVFDVFYWAEASQKEEWPN